MVHSFAFTADARHADLIKGRVPEDAKVYADAGFTALAEQGPRVKAAKACYPEMGDNQEDFLRFFRQYITIAIYNVPVPAQAAADISAARALKVGDTEVFDDIELRKCVHSNELLAFGVTRFGNDTLYFPIVQWRLLHGDVYTDGHTSIEEIKALHRDLDQAKKDRIAAEDAKELRQHRAWGYPLVALALLMLVAVIYATLAKSAGWLAIGFIGSFVACITGMIRSTIKNSTLCAIVAAIGFAGVMSVLFGLLYLTHIGVIK